MATTRPRRAPASVTRAAADEPADELARDGAPGAAQSSPNGSNASNGSSGRSGTKQRKAAKAPAAGRKPAAPRAPSPGDETPQPAPMDPTAILHRAVEEAARLLGTDGAMAYLLDETTGILRFATDAGITDDQRREWVRSLRVDIGVGMFGQAVARDEVVVTADYPADPSFVHFPGADRLVNDLAIRSFLVAPLSSGGRMFGAMGTFASRPDAFGDQEIALVRALADHAAAAMANADLIKQLGRSRADVERRAETERALREIGGRIIGLRHAEEVLQLSVDEAARLLGADGARIDVLDEATGGLYWAYDATTGHRPGLGPIAGTGEAKAGEGISGKAVREMKPIFTGDYLNDERFEHASAPDAHVRRYQIRSVVAVPLIGDRGPLGTLTVYTEQPDAFGEADAQIIEALAGQAAIAMTNARLIEELDRSREQFSHQADAERALREIAARITAIRDPSDLLQHVVDEAARLLRAERVRIDLIMPAAGRVGFTHLPGAGDIIGGAAVDDTGRPFTYGASGKAIATGASVVSGDYANDTGFEHNPDLDAAVRADGVKSLIVTPLSGESGMLGVLQVGSPDLNAFGPAEVGLVEALAHQAAIAIQNARLIEAIAASREEVRRRARAEQALREIATRITAIRDPADLLKQVVDASRDLLDADRAELDLIEPDTGLVRLAHVSGDGDLNRPGPTGLGGVPGDRGINGLAIAHRRAVVTGDYLTDDRFTHTDDFDTFVAESGIHSVVVAPLFTDDGLLGVIKVSAQDRDAYDDEDAALMEAFADQATVAIQNARLIEELGRSREEISRRADAERALREIAANISAIRDPDAVLQQTVDEARRLLESDGARIDLLEGDTLTWAYASGATSTQTRAEGRDMTFKVGEGVAGIAVQQGRTFLTDDYLADARFPHIEQSDDLVERTGYVSVLAAPMRGEHGSLGSISVSSPRTGAYDDASAQLLQALADQAAITIQNARLIAELNRSRTQLRRRAEEEQSLREIAARISATKGARDVLQRTVDEAARLLVADESRIDLIEPESGLLRWAYHSSASTPYGSWEWPDNPDEKIEQGISGLAVLEARVAWTGDYLNDPGFLHASSSDRYVKEIGINSVMSAPLLDAGQVFGALTIYTRRSEAWGTDDARLIEAIANQAAIAISTARLIEELDRSSAELARRAEAQQSLLEIAARITAIREPGPLLQQVVDAAKRLVAGDGSILDLIVPGENVLRWAYDSGIGEKFTAEDLLQLTIPIGVGASGIAVAEGRVIVAGDRPEELFPVSDINDRFFEVTGYRSMIIAPISGESGPLGALEVYSAEAGAFDDADAAVIRSLAYQAAIAIQNARLIEELGRSREEIARRADTERSLREIAARITAIREPGDLLQHVVQEAARLLASDGAIIDLLDPVTGRIEWGYDSGVSEERRLRWRETFVGEDVVRRSLAERATLFTPDYLDDPRFGHTADQNKKARAVGLRSLAIAPLVSERGALGTLTVFSDRPSQFAAADADLLGVLADQATIAMTNARLIEELERSQSALEARAERERSLRDIAARITSLRDPGEILARVVEESRRLLGSDGAHLTRLSDEGTYLVPVIVAGGMDDQTEDWLLRMRFPLGGGINGLAAEEVRAIWTYDYLIDPRIPHEPEDVVAAERLGLRSMAAAPLRAPAGEVIGTLAISYRTPREIAPDELDLLQGLADQAAIALTNSNLYELLGESEARYRYLVQNSPDLVWSIDADARFTFVSDTCERLTGWKPEDLLGKHFGALVHEASRDVAEIDWTAGLDEAQEDRELRGRVNLLHRDGHPIPAEFLAFATRDEAGGFAGANGSVRDMSERDRLERELRDSEHRFRFLIANSPDIIFSIDPDGQFSYVSDGVRRSLGLEPEELVGTPFWDLIRYRADEVPGAQFALLAADPELELTTRMDLKQRDGGVRAFEVSSVGIRRDGVFAGIQGAARDITERERLERELRESEERYRFLVENSPDVVFSTDVEGNFTFLSETIEQMVGFTPDELVGGHFSRIVDERSLPTALERWGMLVAQPERMQVARLLLTRRDGSTVPVEVSSLGQVADGAFAGIHGSTRDVSERERLEQDLRRQAGELASSQERAHLARELHDSVTQALFSMTLVTRTTELLVDRDAEKAKLQLASLRDLQREALAEMRALIFELRPGNIEQDGLLPALRTHAAALQGRIGLPIVVTSDLKDRLPLNLEEVLYRISQEALHNVVKHAAARQVTLSIGKGRGGLRLRIADDGKGFDAAGVPDGHLGLAGMRARAEKIGATLEVDSRPGAGTTIEVFLPDVAIEAARAASPATAEPLRPG